MKAFIQKFVQSGILQPIDAQLADFVARVCGKNLPDSVLLATALASNAVSRGWSSCDLTEFAGRHWNDMMAPNVFNPEMVQISEEVKDSLLMPDIQSWLQDLNSEAAKICIGASAEQRPLVLQGTRLYLRRYWLYEDLTRRKLLQLAEKESEILSVDMDELLRKYFPDAGGDDEATGGQRDAARKALQRQLLILSGGPGTGKTYTLARIVALMAEMYKAIGNSLRVKIAAPTGKAAARVVESIRQAKESLNIDSYLLRQIPEEAFTIHRLLGSQPDSPYFRHNAANKLDVDVVVLDEASMIDLPLMAKLLEALPLSCRLLLVGDRDQLASVEPGRVYGDICEAAKRNSALGNCLTELTYSRRFKADSSIGKLSKMVREKIPEIWQEMHNLQNEDLQLCNVANGFGEEFVDFAVKGYRRFCNSIDPENALVAADEFRVLCAVRHGPFGVIAINRILQQRLLDVHPTLSVVGHQLIMITANDYDLGLFNGDTGVIMSDPATGNLRAWFPAASGGALRSFASSMLPAFEPAFAITVHKSQGSEFDTVALVLPPNPELPVLTRELLYTGITRAKKKLAIWSEQVTFEKSITRQARSASTLFYSYTENFQPGI